MLICRFLLLLRLVGDCTMIIGGLGYATEAAQAALRYAFDVLELSEVIAFTAVINKRSQKLMQRIGMTDTQDNFSHPMLDADHRLAEHVLYKITRQEWQLA